MAQVNIRIDDKLKEQGERLFSALGLSFSSAISVFVSQSVREGGLPFRISTTKLNNTTLASETALAKEWLSSEEDLAWADL